MTELLLNNFAAWSAQIAVLIAIGAIAALTLAPGRARLVFWQILLAIALLLPAIEPWTSRPVQFGDSISISMSAATIVAAPRPASFVWHREDWLWIAAAGIAFRALWIAVGLIRLRRHRLSARPLADPPVPFESLGIRWYVSDTVSGPVTFGWLRPSIVLPSRVLELPADLREAIACHELIHVRRRDWLFVIAEEADARIVLVSSRGVVRAQPASSSRASRPSIRKWCDCSIAIAISTRCSPSLRTSFIPPMSLRRRCSSKSASSPSACPPS